ncbi:hypothetical protein E5676_scaffold3734G00250 [Cucumis melo var. makuwa]|uniref:Uncharacterized protein n=1 Tax=Cucumis melo var. makuwa TaxID=1194695 RepID=A0A5A7UI49_CUCMM|nr:hypothetical protein E6C27_scaffold24G004870 [Cucumis melo var. makuwa]TYK08603.1 hypothetical protein E5676_scaffold3734G00250 [Cucumis melo var. makuwa]
MFTEPSKPSFLHFGSRELTLKFSSSATGLIGDSSPLLGWISLSVDSIKGHNQVSGSVTASCSFCAIVCNEIFTERHRCPDVLCIIVMLMGYVVNWNCMSMDFKVLRLICASSGITRLICTSSGITRLICTSFGITRLIGVSFGITRLIRASFGIMKLMCAFYGTTRLFMQGKGTARGRPTRGKKDAVPGGNTKIIGLRAIPSNHSNHVYVNARLEVPSDCAVLKRGGSAKARAAYAGGWSRLGCRREFGFGLRRRDAGRVRLFGSKVRAVQVAEKRHGSGPVARRCIHDRRLRSGSTT